MRKWAVLLLCAGLVALAWHGGQVRPRRFERQHPWTSPSDPFTPESMRARLERIAPIVSEIVGFPIDLAQLSIVAVDDRDAAEQEFEELFADRLTPEDDDFDSSVVDPLTWREYRWLSLLGRYHPKKDLISIVRIHFDSFSPDDIDGALDVVVAHELAHAWQDQQFRAFDDENPSISHGESVAKRAVTEGSAEYVAREVAARIGASAAFSRIQSTRDGQNWEVKLLSGDRRIESVRFWPYSQGLEFIDAVHRARGNTASTWERLFRDPPRALWSIAHPEEWLAQKTQPVASLQGWADRFVWCLKPKTSRGSALEVWEYLPIFPSEIAERRERAGIPESNEAWSRCRGGVVVRQRGRRGGLTDSVVRLRVWQMRSALDAEAARASLETAARKTGAIAWTENSSALFVGATRQRAGTGGATAYSQMGMDRSDGEPVEEVWALRVHGNLLFEAVSDRVGSAPALLDILETAAQAMDQADEIDRARLTSAARTDGEGGRWSKLARLRAGKDSRPVLNDRVPPAVRDEVIARLLARPQGEEEVQTWLRSRPDAAAAAFLAGLAPASGDRKWDDSERGPSVIAALRNADLDVRLFVLAFLGKDDIALRPFASDVVPLIRAAASDKHEGIRALAVRAANVVAPKETLGKDRIQQLLSDASPLVRASLASCRKLLSKDDRVLLRGDKHEVVRRAATTGSDDVDRQPFDVLAKRPGLSAKERQRAKDYGFLIGLSWGIVPSKNRKAELVRVRRLLHSEVLTIRLLAISAVQSLGDDQTSFTAELLAAFDNGPCRRSASAALMTGGFDLEPYRPLVVRLLLNPFCRAEMLRVIAANDFELPDRMRATVQALMSSDNAELACAAALVLFENDTQAEETLSQRWSSVFKDFRVQIIGTVIRRKPDSALAAQLRIAGLASPFCEEREAVFESIDSDTHSTAHWDALLQRISDGGSEVAGECWKDLAGRVDELDNAEKEIISARLVHYLNLWCERGRLPLFSWRASKVYSWNFDDWPTQRALVAALDRCILRSDAPSTRLVFALIREAVTSEAIPPAVLSKMEELFLMPKYSGEPAVADEVLKAVTSRSAIRVEVVVEILLRWAREPWERYSSLSSYEVDSLLGEDDARRTAARALVPKLIDRADRRSLAVALEITEALRRTSDAELALLRDCAVRALPIWRKKIEECVAPLVIVD